MKDLNLYLLTFNCARTLIQPDVFGTYIFHALPEDQRATLPDLLVLNLQEIAPIGYSFLGGSFLTPYLDAFRSAVKVATRGQPYVNVIARNLGMTAIMVFAKQELAPQIAFLKTAGVGVGLQEMGNKGAVGVKLGLRIADSREVMESTFVSAHLAPAEDALQRRNEDWRAIVRGMVFTDDKAGKVLQQDDGTEDTPLLQGLHENDHGNVSGMFSPRSHLFVAGDLNYRTADEGPGPEGHRQFPIPKVEGEDPRHYSALLRRDQLTKERQEGRALHGLGESAIHFPPTYKYATKARAPAQMDDVEAWDWSKHRWPSWCDRILYLDFPKWMKPNGSIQVHSYDALPLFLTSDHRAVALSLTIPLRSIAPPPQGSEDVRLSPPFELDMNWNSKRSAARRKELVVGLLAYLGLTWEGNGLLVATIIGAVGGYFIIKSLLAV